MRFQVFFLAVSLWVPLSQMPKLFYDNITPGFALFICNLILVSFCGSPTRKVIETGESLSMN